MKGCMYRTEKDICLFYSHGDIKSWCDPRECEAICPSNGDRLRAATDEELARWIHDQIVDRNIGVSVEVWLEWLRGAAK